MIKKDVIEIIYKIKDLAKTQEGYFTELDAAIGDGDFGTNLNTGFSAVNPEEFENEDLSGIFKNIAMKLMSTIGGTSGVVLGTLFLSYAKVIADKEEIDIELWAQMNTEAYEAIQARAGAKLGDKTLLDVLIPYAEELKASKSLEEATIVAETKAKETADYSAARGRASYLGDRSLGHQDAGATALSMMARVLIE